MLRGVLAPALASIEPFAIPSTSSLGAGGERARKGKKQIEAIGLLLLQRDIA